MSETCALGDLATIGGLVGGPFGSSLVGSDYTKDGIPVIRGTNLGGGRFLIGPNVFVTPEKASRDLNRNIAVPGDIIFTQRGTLGQAALVPPHPWDRYVVSQSQMRLRVNAELAESLFVYYACIAPEFLRQIHDNAISTGVPHINLGILSRLRIPLFPLRRQRAIAEVLGALDDKIAANAKLACTVDSVASTMFRDVVRHATVATKFEEIADIGGGGTPRTSRPDYWDGGIPWATPTDVTALDGPYLESTTRTISEAGLAACPSKLYPAGSILMTSRATVGAFAVAQRPVAVNQGFIVANANDRRLQWWLFHDMRSRVEEFVSFSNGATFLELNRGSFKRLSARLSDERVMVEFGIRVDPLHGRASQALTESRMLAALRDTLLPQLMSGKLRAKDAEKQVEDVV